MPHLRTGSRLEACLLHGVRDVLLLVRSFQSSTASEASSICTLAARQQVSGASAQMQTSVVKPHLPAISGAHTLFQLRFLSAPQGPALAMSSAVLASSPCRCLSFKLSKTANSLLLSSCNLLIHTRQYCLSHTCLQVSALMHSLLDLIPGASSRHDQQHLSFTFREGKQALMMY